MVHCNQKMKSDDKLVLLQFSRPKSLSRVSGGAHLPQKKHVYSVVVKNTSFGGTEGLSFSRDL